MAVSKPNETAASDETELVEVTQLQKNKNTSASVFSGICAAEGWRPGKSVSESDYDRAVKSFMNRPVGKAGN